MTTPSVEQETTLELGLCEYVEDLGWAITRPDVDLQKMVKDHDAVIRMRRSGGVQQPWQLVARITYEVYAATYTKAWETAEAVSARLVDVHYTAGGWRIDRGVSESANTEMAHPNLRLVAGVVRVTTRDLP